MKKIVFATLGATLLVASMAVAQGWKPATQSGNSKDVQTIRLKIESTGRKVTRRIDNDGVRLVRRLSNSPCVRGRSYNYNSREIWVDDGCRAEFEVRRPRGNSGGGWGNGGGGWGGGGWDNGDWDDDGYWRPKPPQWPGGTNPGNGWGNAKYFTVESNDGRRERRYVGTGKMVRLERQISDRPCREGRTWRYENGYIWVDQGCRARFAVYERKR